MSKRTIKEANKAVKAIAKAYKARTGEAVEILEWDGDDVDQILKPARKANASRNH